MTASRHDRLLEQARQLYSSDPERATSLRREIAASGEVSPAWSHAQVDLAAHETSHGNYQAALEHAAAVLEAPADAVDAGARAVAGIVLSDAREALDQDVDLSLLQRSIEAAVAAGHPYYAGSGLVQLGRILQARSERATSKAAFARAVTAFDATESALAGPGALLRLATMEKEDGEIESARKHVSDALVRLDKYPLAGRSGQVMRDKLMKLRDSLG